eukprot:TRINITY_DN16068_c0_g1_i10.p1 TRINITY_DN16068_c0_g1~~TRINITY_DN16068_c0_g1_i10.p1  ORF type:complete len:371 (-),score=66.27 TRINITY_DN16068_c0_g1_i10:153-1265(-)
MGSSITIYDSTIKLQKKKLQDLEDIPMTRRAMISSWKKPQRVLMEGHNLETLSPAIIQTVVSTPAWIEHLREVSVTNCHLKTIPQDFWKLVNLTVLKLSHNELVSVSNYIGENLYRLSHLDLSNNSIIKIPWNLCLCRSLKKLFLHNNCVNYLPNTIGFLEHLEELLVTNNPLVEMEYKDKIPSDLASLKSWISTGCIPATYRAEFKRVLQESILAIPTMKKDEITFLQILRNPDTRASFEVQINKEFSSENLEFWQAVNAFRSKYNSKLEITNNELITQATEIFNTFVKDDCSRHVNLPAQNTQYLNKIFLDNFTYPRGINQWTFNDSQNTIFQLMYSDTYCRWKHTESGKFALALIAKAEERHMSLVG